MLWHSNFRPSNILPTLLISASSGELEDTEDGQLTSNTSGPELLRGIAGCLSIFTNFCQVYPLTNFSSFSLVTHSPNLDYHFSPRYIFRTGSDRRIEKLLIQNLNSVTCWSPGLKLRCTCELSLQKTYSLTSTSS